MDKNLSRNNQGLILIISLWILALLSLLSLGLAHRVAVHIKLTKYQKDKTKLLYIAKAAVQKARIVLEKDVSDVDMLNELWSSGKDFEYGIDESIFKDQQLQDGNFTVSYVFDDSDQDNPVIFFGMSDENRRININTGESEKLKHLLNNFPGVSESESESLVEAILYWRGKHPDPEGYDDSYYREQGYSPRAGNLKTIQELNLVEGFRENPELIQKCKRYLTVFSEDDKININTVSHEVLQAVFMSLEANDGFATRLSDYIIDIRDGPDNVQGTEDDVVIMSGGIKSLMLGLPGGLTLDEEDWINKPETVFPFTDTSNFFTIEVAAQLNQSPIAKMVNSVIKRNDNFSTEIIYWHEK